MDLSKITGCPKCGSPFDYSPRCLKCHYTELSRLRSLATRWYLPDGSYETLPEEEVTRRRMEAAKRAGDVEGIALELYILDTEPVGTDRRRELWPENTRRLKELYIERAAALVAYLSPKVTG